MSKGLAAALLGLFGCALAGCELDRAAAGDPYAEDRDAEPDREGSRDAGADDAETLPAWMHDAGAEHATGMWEAGADGGADSTAPDGEAEDAIVEGSTVAETSDAAPEAAADAASNGDASQQEARRLPTKLPAKGGVCPEFVSGDAHFTPGNGAPRKVRLWAGASGGGALIIYWHGTGAQPSEAEAGLRGVLPEITATGGVVAAPYTGANEGTFPWLSTTSESLRLADEIVACAIENKSIDPGRIHAVGFSAGGLMTSTMGLQRSNYIASVAPYSGGLQGRATFQDAANKYAALIFHGGPSDSYVLNFQSTSNSYNAALRNNGNYTVVCNHGGGHTIPSAGPAAVWRFFQDHPYATVPSPYVAAGLPPGLPSYCAFAR